MKKVCQFVLFLLNILLIPADSDSPAQVVNGLFVTTDTEFPSTPVTVQPSEPIHPPVPLPSQTPSPEPAAELYGSGFALQDDPATSHSLDSMPGGREGKRRQPGAAR